MMPFAIGACGWGFRSAFGSRKSQVTKTKGAVKVGMPIGAMAASIAACTMTVKTVASSA